MANTVINGVNTLSADLAGKAVCHVRGMLAQALNIDESAVAQINGDQVDDESTAVLQDGDELEFVKASGTKG